MATRHTYSWTDLDEKKTNVLDILTVADQIRTQKRIGRMKFDYSGQPVAFWTFDGPHFDRLKEAIEAAKVLREDRTRVKRAKDSGWLSNVL